MDNLLSIDPGKLCLCWAAWDGVDKGARLVEVALSLVDAKLPLGVRAMRHAEQIPHGADRVVVEQMVHYPSEGRKDSLQAQERKAFDLLDLQAIGGIVAGHVVKRGGSITYMTPLDWKGTMSKAHSQHWIGKALDEAGPEERAILERACKRYPKGIRHNLWDGVGIGLAHTRRLRIR